VSAPIKKEKGNETVHVHRRYSAFLSYKHSDNRAEDREWANWLKIELERYQIPRELAGRTLPNGSIIPKTLVPVFRDEDSLPIGGTLPAHIRDGLTRSDALVCLCSPASAQSPWVEQELRLFKEMGKVNRIHAIVIDGHPCASKGEGREAGVAANEECLPRPLLYGVPHPTRKTPTNRPEIQWEEECEVPLWGDLRPEGMRIQGFTTSGAYGAYLNENHRELSEAEIDGRVRRYEQQLRGVIRKLVAGLIGVSHDELLRFEDAEAQRAKRILRRVRLASATLLGLMVLYVLIYWYVLIRPQAILQQYFTAINRSDWPATHHLLDDHLKPWEPKKKMPKSFEGFIKQTPSSIVPAPGSRNPFVVWFRGHVDYEVTNTFEVSLSHDDLEKIRQSTSQRSELRYEDTLWAQLIDGDRYEKLKEGPLEGGGVITFKRIRVGLFSLTRRGLSWGICRVDGKASDGITWPVDKRYHDYPHPARKPEPSPTPTPPEE
jgi:hypothetical protein